MKKLLAVVVFLITAHTQAQQYRIFKTIDAMKNSVAAAEGDVAYVLGYRQTGDGGGGTYIFSDTLKAADDKGAIIKIGGRPGAYVHEISNGIVNLKWWGVQAYTADWKKFPEYDIIDELEAAAKFIQERAPGAELRIEADSKGFTGSYYCSRTWYVKDDLKIKGSAANTYNPLTRIVWPARVACINVSATNANGNMLRFTADDIGISQMYAEGSFGDSTAHGIYSHTQIFLTNVRLNDLSGDGVRIEACAIPKHAIFGNADFSILRNVSMSFTNYGLYITGCDANKITIDKLEATNNRRWGVWDDGFLGNDYKEPHFSANGAGPLRHTVTKSNGKYYVPSTPDQFVNKGYRPEKYPKYWREIPGVGASDWDSTIRYWSGGPLAIVNDNAWSMVMSPYYEEGQPPAMVNSRTALHNGTRGVNTLGGTDFRTLFGVQYLSANLILPKPGAGLGVGGGPAEEPKAPIHAYQNFKQTGQSDVAIFESATPEMWIKLKNSAGWGFINYYYDAIRFLPAGKPGLAITATATLPDGISNTKTLGDANNQWMVGYINKLNMASGNANAAVGSIYLKNGKATVTTTALTAASKIFVSVSKPAGAQGFLSTQKTSGDTFVITSTGSTENSEVNWWIVN
ncbi:MAG: hypothetical protein ABIO05_05550 [Ferruginibacter sp.]